MCTKNYRELKIFMIVGELQQMMAQQEDDIQFYIVASMKDDTLEISPKGGY